MVGSNWGGWGKGLPALLLQTHHPGVYEGLRPTNSSRWGTSQTKPTKPTEPHNPNQTNQTKPTNLFSIFFHKKINKPTAMTITSAKSTTL